MKRLFGGREVLSAELEAHALTGTVVEDEPAPSWHRPQAPVGPVDWPVDPATQVVFDDAWLLAGLKRAVNENQFNAKLEARDGKAQLRRERLYEPGLDGHDQAADMLRGRDWLEWDQHVYQMKREGFLENALALVYEMIDVAGRSPSYENNKVPPGWYHESAVILRKLKRPEEEVRILRTALADYPDSVDFLDRLAKAETLLAKAQASG